MGTQLFSLYDVLADMPVAVNEIVVPARNLDNLKNSIGAGDCPVRLLMPLGTRVEARAVNAVTISGTTASVQWRMTDLLLWKPAGSGGGLRDEAVPLVAYMTAYFDALHLQRFRLGRNAVVENVTFEPTMVNFPGGGASWFYGVDVTLFVKEIVS